MGNEGLFDGFRNAGEGYTIFDYLYRSAFDELVEIDLASDTIRNIYHVDNKYYVPVLKGGFMEMRRFAAEEMVHPEDRAIFEALMDPDTLPERLSAAEPKGLLRADLREKLTDGSYRWVQYILLSGAETGVPEGKADFFVYDVQNQRDRDQGRTPSSGMPDPVDALTGLHRRADFFRRADEMLEKRQVPMCIIAVDIEHFRVFNAWFGREKGDYLLARIGKQLQELERGGTSVCGYFGMDDFCVLMPWEELRVLQLYRALKQLITSRSNAVGFDPAFGISRAEKPGQSAGDLYEQAVTALHQPLPAGHGREKLHLYDEAEANRVANEYRLLNDFRLATENGSITFYLQPQCRASNGRIVGAEALARWVRPDGTMIPPGSFVPVLEKNGFITDLDKHIWRQVCAWLRELLDRGIEPVPVSVNVSAEDIEAIDVPGFLGALLDRFNLPPYLLKAEITESAYAANDARVSHFVSELQRRGILVLMDDFGAGYSSLSMLNSVSVDVIKLDMNFIRSVGTGSRRGMSIVESVVSMSKSMGLPVIVEGVEKAEEVQFLHSLGCRYIQGYYFYRPMPRAEMEKLLAEPGLVDDRGLQFKRNEQFHIRDFMDETVVSDAMLNSMLGPMAVYRLSGKDLNIVRFNEQFYDSVSDAHMEDRQTAIQHYILPEDHEALYRALEQARQDAANGAVCTVRVRKSNGGVFWYHMKLYHAMDDEKGQIFYGQLVDVTDQWLQSVRYFDYLKSRSPLCMRINLSRGKLQYVRPEVSFADTGMPTMDVSESLQKTVETRIPEGEDRERFRRFFSPARLMDAYHSGIFEEELTVSFDRGGGPKPTTFYAYYQGVAVDQEIYAYVFC